MATSAWGSGSFSQDVNDKIASGAGTSFQLSQLSIEVPLGTWSADNEILNVDFRFDQTNIDWEGTTVPHDNYYWLGVPLTYRQWRAHGSEIVFKLTPGLMTDMNVFLEAFTIDFEASIRRYIRPNLYWEIGGLVNRNMGDTNLHPLGAVSWRSQSHLEIKLGYPYSLINMPWTSNFETYFSIKPAGGVWKAEMEIDGHTKVTHITYRNWQAGLGVSHVLYRKLWGTFEIGQKWDRKIRAVDDEGASLHARPASSLFWQFSLFVDFD